MILFIFYHRRNQIYRLFFTFSCTSKLKSESRKSHYFQWFLRDFVRFRCQTQDYNLSINKFELTKLFICVFQPLFHISNIKNAILMYRRFQNSALFSCTIINYLKHTIKAVMLILISAFYVFMHIHMQLSVFRRRTSTLFFE